MFRQGHIGRLASYTLMAAEADMIGLITADSGRSAKQVAPFGGAEARIGTNPLSIAVPSDLDGPLFLDMATSAVAAGKISLAVSRGESIPLGWIIDRDGKPTTDPTQLRKGGALLPLGGNEGYKGSGLAVIVEILCGLLTGLGFGVEPTGRHNDGCFMAVFKVDAFRPLAQFKQEVTEFARYLKATPPAEGQPRRALPGRDRAPARAGPPRQRHRGRGRHLAEAARDGGRLRHRGQARPRLTPAGGGQHHRPKSGGKPMTTADATKRDLSTMLRPRSIALIGATDRSSWSRNTFDNLTKRTYAGEVHLVARRGGDRAWARGGDLLRRTRPEGRSRIADGADGGDRGGDGRSRRVGRAQRGDPYLRLRRDRTTAAPREQDKLAAMARRHGISVLGPNCLGFVNFLDDVPLWTGAFRAPSQTGPIAIISQSGATAAFIASLAHQQEIGLSHMISTGNEADLDSAAFVDHLLDDERVRAIVMFTETIRDAHRFAAAAQRARAAGKPIIVLKIGLSDVTARSAQAHTGALVGDNRVFDGVCKQFGVVRVNSVEDLLFTADVIARTGVLKPKGLGIVSVSGGACEIAADRAQLEGVSLPPLSEGAAQALDRDAAELRHGAQSARHHGRRGAGA